MLSQMLNKVPAAAKAPKAEPAQKQEPRPEQSRGNGFLASVVETAHKAAATAEPSLLDPVGSDTPAPGTPTSAQAQATTGAIGSAVVGGNQGKPGSTAPKQGQAQGSPGAAPAGAGGLLGSALSGAIPALRTSLVKAAADARAAAGWYNAAQGAGKEVPKAAAKLAGDGFTAVALADQRRAAWEALISRNGATQAEGLSILGQYQRARSLFEEGRNLS